MAEPRQTEVETSTEEVFAVQMKWPDSEWCAAESPIEEDRGEERLRYWRSVADDEQFRLVKITVQTITTTEVL